jgi:hypothetical protein
LETLGRIRRIPASADALSLAAAIVLFRRMPGQDESITLGPGTGRTFAGTNGAGHCAVLLIRRAFPPVRHRGSTGLIHLCG